MSDEDDFASDDAMMADDDDGEALDPAQTRLGAEHPHRPQSGKKHKSVIIRKAAMIPSYPLQHAARAPRV